MKNVFTKKEMEVIKFGKDLRINSSFTPIVVAHYSNNGVSWDVIRTIKLTKLLVKKEPSAFNNVVLTDIYALL